MCIFTSFTYNALNYTQIINASLFNTAIPVTIILVCFLLKIEKTNIFQISGLIISVLGILAIITRLDPDVLLSLNFNEGDLFMIVAIIAWGVYSAYLRKQTFNVSLLTLVHIICTFGLIFLLPLFILDVAQGRTVEISSNLFYILIYIAIFPSIGSYYCWAGAVSIIGANRAGIFLSLIPLFSTLMAIFFYNEQFKLKFERIILYVAGIGFLIHLLLIFIFNIGGFPTHPEYEAYLGNPIAAIYTPFSFILVYEIYLLVYYLPKSFSISIAKQFEIVSLILIRIIFKDIGNLNLEEFKLFSANNLNLVYGMICMGVPIDIYIEWVYLSLLQNKKVLKEFIVVCVTSKSTVTGPDPSPPEPFIPTPVVILVTPPTENCVKSILSDPTLVGVSLNF